MFQAEIKTPAGQWRSVFRRLDLFTAWRDVEERIAKANRQGSLTPAYIGDLDNWRVVPVEVRRKVVSYASYFA
jgi:hypothetical protein